MKTITALRRSDDEKKNILKIYVKAHTWDKVEMLDKGDVVRKRHLIGIVVRQKSTERDGLVAWVCASKCEWYHELNYCPYLHELAYNGSCDLVTEAVSKDDGIANHKVIDELMKAKEVSDRNRSIGMAPPSQCCFPAFDSCKSFAENAYLPAVNELLQLTDDKDLFTKYVRLEKELANVNIKDENGTCFFWTSTDAQCSYSDGSDSFATYYSDAFAIKIDNEGNSELLSFRKTKKVWSIPFCRF